MDNPMIIDHGEIVVDTPSFGGKKSSHISTPLMQAIVIIRFRVKSDYDPNGDLTSPSFSMLSPMATTKA